MSNLTQTLPNGDIHGLINTIGNSVPDDGFKHFDEKMRAKLIKDKKEDEKIVKAIYINSRGGTERYEQPYGKYPGQPITLWKLIHNHTYEMPKGLFDQINEMPELPNRSEVCDANGVPTKKDGKGEKLHRMFLV